MSQLPEIPDRTTGLEPWPVQGPPQVVFEHAFFPTVMEQDVRLPGGKVVPWLRYANHRDGREIRDGVRPRGSDAPADEGEVIEPMFLPIGRIDAMIRSGKIDNVTVLAGWALVRAAGRLSTACPLGHSGGGGRSTRCSSSSPTAWAASVRWPCRSSSPWC